MSFAKTSNSVLRTLLKKTMEFALPWQCTICGDETHRGNDSFCTECLQSLMHEKNCCLRCGAVAGPYANASKGCPHCRRRPFRFRSARCLGMYEDSLKAAIVRSKWSYSSAALLGIGRLLAEQQGCWLRSLNVDILLPIPQTWTTRLQRYFNPASIIAECVGRSLRVPIDRHVLRRQGRTAPQKRVPVQKRFENQKNAFRIRDSHVITGRRLLLVDDVMTSGATCSEAARMLKKAGAADVNVLVAARVADRR